MTDHIVKGMPSPQSIVELVESGRWPAGASSQYEAWQAWRKLTEEAITMHQGFARSTPSVVEYQHDQDVISQLQERLAVLMAKLREKRQTKPGQECLHLYGTHKEIAALAAVLPGSYKQKNSTIFYEKKGVSPMDTVFVYHTVLVSDHFTDEAMHVAQAVAYMQPFMLYRLCDEHGQLLYNIESDRNQNEDHFLCFEDNFMLQMYDGPTYFYSFDIRCKLGLMCAAVCQEPNYRDMAEETEVLREAICSLETAFSESECNVLVAIASYLGMRLADHKRTTTPENRRGSLQRQLVCKTALQMALAGIEPAEMNEVKTILSR